MQARYTVELLSGRFVEVQASENASIERIKFVAQERFGEQAREVRGMQIPKRVKACNGWPKGKSRKNIKTVNEREPQCSTH